MLGVQPNPSSKNPECQRSRNPSVSAETWHLHARGITGGGAYFRGSKPPGSHQGDELGACSVKKRFREGVGFRAYDLTAVSDGKVESWVAVEELKLGYPFQETRPLPNSHVLACNLAHTLNPNLQTQPA